MANSTTPRGPPQTQYRYALPKGQTIHSAVHVANSLIPIGDTWMADTVRDMETLVFDIGSGMTKVGLAGAVGRTDCFSTIVGHRRIEYIRYDHKIDIGGGGSTWMNNISYPIERGIVRNWDDMERILSYIYNHYSYDSWKHPVIFAETPLNPESNREKMTQIMFERYHVPALSFEIPGVLSLFASNRTTGIALDCGEGVTYAAPVHNGNVIADAVVRTDFAGRELTDALVRIMEREWPCVRSSRIHMEGVKKECGYVALDYEQEKTRLNELESMYRLPDGKLVQLKAERFKCTEVLFRPSVIDNVEVGQIGVHELLYQSLMKCREGIKEVLCDNIVLTGGSTMFPGFENRMNKELTKLIYRHQVNQKIEVVAPLDRQKSACIGGSLMASLSSYHKCFISKSEYDEEGQSIGCRKSLWIDPSGQPDIVNEDSTTEGDETTSGYYDVFLSFRGADTRDGFTNDLYTALKTEGINVYRDDNELKIGDEIEVILKAIDKSSICVPVLSRNFATSSWCLREVERMVNLKKDIVPIFFYVRTNDVKLETNLYSDALLKQEASKGKYRVQRWRDALKDIPKLKGRTLKEKEDPKEFIKQFVKEILVKLNFKPRYYIQHLVQVPEQVENALKLLSIGFGGKRLVAIHGMPGIGKTTLAKVIFNQIYRDFDCCAFLEDVQESLQGSGNLHFLRDELLRALDPMLKDVSRITGLFEKLKADFRDKKVLVVLDDVDDRDQVYDLVGDSNWFGSDSRIIITTRDKRVLESTGESSTYTCYAFEMNEMNSKQALELFSKCAFGKHSPPSDWMDIASEVVSAAGLLPLALESVGSFLQNQEEEVWENTINKLKEEPNHAIQKKLKQIYGALNVQQRKMFLDIAFFLTEDEKKELINGWEAYGFLDPQEIKVLISLSMIGYNTDEKSFWVQDQVRHFARVIARQRPRASNESLKYKDTLGRLDEKMENERFEALSSHSEDIGHFTGRVEKMELSSSNDDDLLGSNFCPRNLVILCLKESIVDENWHGWKVILVSHKLQVLDLTECNNLTCVPSNLSEAVNLEKLVLRNCKKLTRLASIQSLEKLKELDVGGCRLLNGLPESIGELKSLVKLDLSDTYISALPWTIGKLLQLQILDLTGCCRLQVLPASFGNLEMLVVLKLEGTSIGWLPFYIRNLKCTVAM